MNRMMKNECEYIDVFFSGSNAGAFLLRSEEAVDRTVVNLGLSFGNIRNVNDPKSRNKDYKYSFFDFKRASYVFHNRFLTKEHGLNYLKETDRKIRIWAGKRNSDELCGLYYLVSELADKELYLVDIPVYNDARRIFDDSTIFLDSGPKRIKSIDDTYDPKPLGNFDFHKLSNEEKLEYSSIWTRLVNENGDIRAYIPDSGIVSMRYSDFYETLSKGIGEDGDEAIKIVGDYLSGPKDPQLNYHQLKAILGKMIKDGVVDTVEVLEKDPYYGLISPVIKRKTSKEKNNG